ncbi:MAG: DUF2029 domain-containing protein [Acidobacteriia bacterium]|nr:DUF2029 domain-containing protein [Terriglobia bacterium]
MKPVPYYLKALAMGIPAYLIGVHLWTWVFMTGFYLGGHSDFRQLYTGGFMLRTGHAHELYDLPAEKRFEDQVAGMDGENLPMPIAHPAYEELLFAPLSILGYKPAYFTFLGLNVVLLIFIYYLMQPWTRNLAAIFPWLPAALFVAFLPVAIALIQGQDSVILLALLVITWLLLRKGHEFAAGSVLAMGLFKLQIAVPIIALFVLWRRMKFCAAFVFGASALATVSVTIVGLAQAKAYVRMLLYLGNSYSGHGYPLVVERMANIHGFIFGLGRSLLSPHVIVIVTLLLTATVFLLLLKAAPDSSADALLFAICAAIPLSYYLLPHDLTILLLPLLILLDSLIGSEGTTDLAAQRTFRLAALVFVSPLLVSYSVGHFYLVLVPVACLVFSLMSGRSSAFSGVHIAAH